MAVVSRLHEVYFEPLLRDNECAHRISPRTIIMVAKQIKPAAIAICLEQTNTDVVLSVGQVPRESDRNWAAQRFLPGWPIRWISGNA
jgi:hypothetical protein